MELPVTIDPVKLLHQKNEQHNIKESKRPKSIFFEFFTKEQAKNSYSQIQSSIHQKLGSSMN